MSVKMSKTVLMAANQRAASEISRRHESRMTRSMEDDIKHTLSRRSIIKLMDEAPRYSHCKWIYGEGRNREFCRNPVMNGMSWCSKHTEEVFQPTALRRRALKDQERKMVKQRAEA